MPTARERAPRFTEPTLRFTASKYLNGHEYEWEIENGNHHTGKRAQPTRAPPRSSIGTPTPRILEHSEPTGVRIEYSRRLLLAPLTLRHAEIAVPVDLQHVSIAATDLVLAFEPN
jgi:hypothetical protein